MSIDSDEEAALAAVTTAIFTGNIKHKKGGRKKNGFKPWLQRQNSYGSHSRLLRELRLEEKETYKNYFHMAPGIFKELLGYIKKDILNEGTHLRESIPMKSN